MAHPNDNGGEFNNDEVRDMAENFNREIKTTDAYTAHGRMDFWSVTTRHLVRS